MLWFPSVIEVNESFWKRQARGGKIKSLSMGAYVPISSGMFFALKKTGSSQYLRTPYRLFERNYS